MANRWGNNENRLYFLGLQKSLQMVTEAMKLKDTWSLEEKLSPTRQPIKQQIHYFANKGPSRQGYGFSSDHVWMWKLDYKESWVSRNWCFWTVVLEKTLESRLDCKEIQPVHPKGDQSWVFIERTDAEAETPVFWPPDQRTDSLEKTLMLGKIDGGRRRVLFSRGWDGWMGSPTQWTWICVDSRSWWWTGRPGMLQSMGSHRFGHEWETELNWTAGQENVCVCCALNVDNSFPCSYRPSEIWNLGLQKVTSTDAL